MKYLALVFTLFFALPVGAVLPDEVLEDPALESRARDLSKELRCLVCRNENIDESNAGLARDLRLLVRERLLAGDDNDEVISFIVERYGEYVLLNPLSSGSNKLLWYAGPAMFLLALGIGFGFVSRRSKAHEAEDLSQEEQARLDDLLGQ